MEMLDFSPCGRRPLVRFAQHEQIILDQLLYYYQKLSLLGVNELFEGKHNKKSLFRSSLFYLSRLLYLYETPFTVLTPAISIIVYIILSVQ